MPDPRTINRETTFGAADRREENADLRRLRAENKRLRDERDAAVGARDHASSDAYERGFRAGQRSLIRDDEAASLTTTRRADA